MVTAQDKPLVSIGLPVFNGETYIRQALDSLLGQSYANLEVTICDNASTDGTQEISRLYCERDKRVRYHRNSINLSILPNWRLALDLASGDYFTWAAHDDCWSENYIETLLACLISNPKAVLAAGKTIFVDSAGVIRADMEPDRAPPGRSQRNLEAAKELLLQHATNWLHGLYRKKTLLSECPTFFSHDSWGSDVLFLLELCLRYRVVGSDEAIIYKRVLEATHPRAPNTAKDRAIWQCWFARVLMTVILKSPVSPKEKLEMVRTYISYLKWLYFRHGLYSWTKLWLRAGYHCARDWSNPHKRTS